MSTKQQHGRARGRPPKAGGPRGALYAELPEGLLTLLKTDATQRGIPFCDRLAQILASHYATEEVRGRTG